MRISDWSSDVCPSDLRIVRDPEGRVGAIVEHKDATEEQRHIRTINTGILAADAVARKGWLQRLSSDNTQGEYYLTDVVEMAATEYNAAEMVAVDDPIETEGSNAPWQLAQLERAFQRRQVRALCALAVRFADPARVGIRGEVTDEQDVEIDVDVVFDGRVRSDEHRHELLSLMRKWSAVFGVKTKRRSKTS